MRPAKFLVRYLGVAPVAPGLTQAGTVRGLVLSLLEGALFMVAVSLVGGPYLAGFVLGLGGTTGSVALVTALPMLATAVQVLTVRLFSPSWSRVKILTAGAFIHRVGWGLLGVATLLLVPEPKRFGVYAAGLFVTHIAQGATVPVWWSLVSDLTDQRVRGRFLGLRAAVLAGVAMVTVVLAGRLLDAIPGHRGFLVLHVLSAVTGLLNVWALRVHPEPTQATAHRPCPLAPLREAAFVRVLLFVGAWTLAQSVAVPFYAMIMLHVMQIPYGMVGWLTVAASLAATVSPFFWGPFCDWRGSGRLVSYLVPVAALVPLGWLAANAGGVYLLACLQVLQGATFSGLQLAYGNMNLSVAGEGTNRAAHLALFAGTIGLSAGIGPLLGGLLARPSLGLALSGGLSLGLCLIWWGYYKRHGLLRVAMAHGGGEASAFQGAAGAPLQPGSVVPRPAGPVRLADGEDE